MTTTTGDQPFTLDEFIEFVTDRTGFCVVSAGLDPRYMTVTIEFDVELDGRPAVVGNPTSERTS
jgi:predicted homoserine dehydrogenase-like protein